MEVVGKPNDEDVESAHAVRVSRHTLLHHCSGNFLRFHSQDEHNASFFSIKFVNLGTKHVLGLTMQKYKKYYVAQDFFDSH
jgi:hypothetical protein